MLTLEFKWLKHHMQIKKLSLDKKNISFFAFVTLLGGCDDMGASNVLTGAQPLAKFNGDFISFNQFSAELGRAHLDTHVDINIKNSLLSRIIDRQFNLACSPEVVEAFNSAKAQIYAQACFTNRVAKLPLRTAEEIAIYKDAHPEMFVHRRVFATQDVIFIYDPTLMDLGLLQDSIWGVKSLRANLKSNHIKHCLVSGHFSTDTLPLMLATKLKTATVGHLLFAHENMKVIIKSIASIAEIIMQEAMRLRKLSDIKVLGSNMH